MKENRLLGLLAVAAVVLLGVFGWLVIKLSNPTEPVMPYFPGNSETYLDSQKTWQRKSFQPIFKKLIEVDLDHKYLIVSYIASESGVVEEGKIFLGRQTPYFDETGKMTVIESVKLKDVLKTGDQFGVEYLSQFPADLSKEIVRCQSPEPLSIRCLLAFLKQESDKKGENVFYPFWVYRVLKR